MRLACPDLDAVLTLVRERVNAMGFLSAVAALEALAADAVHDFAALRAAYPSAEGRTP